MTTKRRVQLVLYSTTAALIVGAIVLFRTAPVVDAAPNPDDSGSVAAVAVQPLRISSTATRQRVAISASIKPVRQVDLVAEVAGRVVEHVGEHSRVEAGQVIARIDPTLYSAALQRTRASVERARATLELAELELERASKLSGGNVIGRAELDRYETEARGAQAALAEAEAMEVEASERLERTSVKAPFDGILSDLTVEQGDRLEVGVRFGTVVDLSQVELEIGLGEREIIAVQPDEPVIARLSIFGEREFHGRVRDIGRSLDTTTRRFPIEVVLDNPDEVMLPGMVADVSFAVGAARERVRIPRMATAEEFGMTYVYVIAEQEGAAQAHKRRVSVRELPFEPATVEVLEGVEAGERIVASGLRHLRDGLRLRVEDGR